MSSDHKPEVLIIDDERNILKSLSNILRDKFNVTTCHNSLEWKNYFSSTTSIVLLDLWMPGKDGFLLMKEIKEQYNHVPIIVMSGHANISTTVEILKKGADDFIEKPFHHSNIMQKINSLLDRDEGVKSHKNFLVSPLISETSRKQKTIARSIVLTGKGLHKGSNTGLILLPSPIDTGIVFEDIASEQNLEAHIDNLSEANFYATTLRKQNFSLTVVEHLLSTLHMYGIDNLLVKVSEEIPIFDGSAITFCQALDEVGVVEQDGKKKELVIDQEYVLHDEQDNQVWIKFIPHNGFAVSYTLKFPDQFGEQKYDVDLSINPKEIFIKEIAPCRTFGFLDEIKQLYSHGLAKGSDLETGILIDKDQVINTKLLFPNEFARHKVLDIIGDLYLCGCEFRGKVIGHLSGHRHTTLLQKKILSL